MNTNIEKDTHPLMVSIQCFSYNHAPYIRQCLEGFIMQKTNFRFEAIVHDDASTDGTADIIREYAEKYPNIIKPIYETENQYSKHDGSLRRIMYEACTGKYIAICEGDDYWTDPQKLQIQVDFMESHPDYSMCFHRAAVLDYIGINSYLRCFDIQDRDYTSDELFSQWIVPTNSMVYRRECMDYPITHKENILNGDIFIVLACSHTGKVRGIPNYMSVYRIQEGGVTYDSKKQKERMMKYPEHDECIRENFPKISKDLMNRVIGLHYYYRSQLQTDEKLRKKDYTKAMQYIPQILKQKRNQELKIKIKKIIKKIFFPYYMFS